MKENPQKYVKLYRRILKYPPVLTARKKGPMRIIHHLVDGEVIIEAPKAVTVEDLEKALAIIWLAQHNKAKITEGINEIIIQTSMYQIAQICNNHNYLHIWQCLKKVATLTIEYIFQKHQEYFALHVINKVHWDNKDASLSVSFDKTFFELCMNKALKMDLQTYINLSPVSKNLYSFFITNSYSKFEEKTLIERAVIMASALKNQRRILLNSLQELKEKSIIKNFSKQKINKTWIYYINR